MLAVRERGGEPRSEVSSLKSLIRTRHRSRRRGFLETGVKLESRGSARKRHFYPLEEVGVSLQDFFDQSHWQVVDVLATEPRAAELHAVADLPLSPPARAYLDQSYPDGIFRHQKNALRSALDGQDVCLVTGTSSGKSLVFQTMAIDLLARNPDARIMAIYPMKALGNEQRDRWQKALVSAGLATVESAEYMVGRVDGSVPPGFRQSILERSRVVVFTPDIIHAWLFSNLNQPTVINFLREVRLIVVDEVHAYSGVFGSNAAFLFRRIAHLLTLLGRKPQYICASATIARPAAHLKALFGREFTLVGPDQDTSPRFPLEVILAEPSGEQRFLDEVVRLLEYLTHQSDSRFIAFVDSRKQVELISSILSRLLRESAKAAAAAEAEAAETAGEENGERPATRGRRAGRPSSRSAAKKTEPSPEEEEADPEGEVTGVLQQLNVLPYRAGYEDHDRRQIQERLAAGTLNGVVSTSALELGIDIPHLDVCVLIGVPGSATSLQQRIGRIGRHSPGQVIVVNGGDVHDQAVFAHPQSFFQRPLAESTLYLKNEHIQYIHTLCLARAGGEHDQVLAAARGERRRSQPVEEAWNSSVEWPEHFMELCQMERSDGAPRHLASLKLEGKERPNYTFPLRDVESQFKVERRDGPNTASMGSLSFAQLMREAYPGAIYYYATIPYRVTRVNVKAKVVSVRREKRYTTQPQKTLPAIFPRLSPGGIFAAQRQAGLLSLETSLLVRESIRGVIEQRGRTESQYPYPLARELGFFQDQPYFSRNYFTTGVVLTHPALAFEGINLEAIAAILYEAFMLRIPFERQDIGFAADHFRQARLGADSAALIQPERPFLTLYDQIYGSLRLSKRLLDPTTQGEVLAEAVLLGGRQENLARSPASLHVLAEMAEAVFSATLETLHFGFAEEANSATRDPAVWERVVMPGSKGLMVRTNEEFHVLRILNTPMGLSYEGTPVSMIGTGASVMPLLGDVADIPGESQVGWYNLQTGELEAISSGDAAQLQITGEPQPAPAVDPTWLEHILAVYFDDGSLSRLAAGLKITAPAATEREALIQKLLDSCPTRDLLHRALEEYLDALDQPVEVE